MPLSNIKTSILKEDFLKAVNDIERHGGKIVFGVSDEMLKAAVPSMKSVEEGISIAQSHGYKFDWKETDGESPLLHALKKAFNSCPNYSNKVVVESEYEFKGDWLWPKEDHVGYNIIKDEVNDIEKILKYVKDFGRCVQAGGNVGVWPKRYAKYFEQVITFEPYFRNFYCLSYNVKEENVVKMNCGVGRTNSFAKVVNDEPNNNGAVRLEESKENFGVPVVSIDSLNLNSCGLIQFDIEGYEHFAIEGALETIKKFRPVICLELKGHGEKYGCPDELTISLLNRMGYVLIERVRKDSIFICL